MEVVGGSVRMGGECAYSSFLGWEAIEVKKLREE